MSPAPFAFLLPSTAALHARTRWTGAPLASPPPRKVTANRTAPALTLSPGQSLRRALTIQKQNQLQHQPPAPVAPPVSATPSNRYANPLSAFFLRPARGALALAARVAKRSALFRRQHASGLKYARMGATFALAMASFFITRGTMSGIANIGAPSLPALPFKLAIPGLPPSVQAVFKPFTEAFGVVFLSEFGDKSMFATALMAMKHSPIIVCIGALAALTIMTFIACFLGQLMHYLPATVTHYSSIALFVFFGLQMILQARSLPDTPGGVGGERADAEEMVADASMTQVQSPLAVLAKVSSLIFVAEWCDRSMLATMALAASSNTVAVIGGATFANIVCTGMAVCAATLVASRISERMVALVAGILFEFFAVFTYFEGPEGQ